MRDWAGRRSFPRYPIVVPFRYTANGGDSARSGAGWTSNLSEGGACLELAEQIDTATDLSVVFRTDQGSVATEGQVVWARESGRTAEAFHGVAFTRVSPDDHQALQDLLTRKRMVWQAVVRISVGLPVICHPKGQPRSIHQGRTENISRRGLSIRLPAVLPPGTLLEVTLQTSHGPLIAEGTIVRVEPLDAQVPGEPIRHGFRFTEISSPTEMTLGRVLAEVT